MDNKLKLKQVDTIELKELTLEEAEEAIMCTDYAIEATHQDINPINKADASAFYLEGYNACFNMFYDMFESGRIMKLADQKESNGLND